MPENFHFWMMAGGLLVGLVVAWRTMGTSPPEASGDDLELSDLTQQRDEIYAELRNLGPDASESDRKALEVRAADTLRRLEKLEASAPKPAKAKPAKADPAPRGFVAKHPLLSGALLGGGMVGLVALLIFWAQGDAKPRPEEPSQAPPMQSQAGEEFDRGEPELPPQLQAIIDEMLARLEENPEDLETRKSLLTLLLENAQFFQAFGQAREILSRNADDPDGLYAVGLVRYTMGQPAEALESLQAALTSDPAYVQASLIKGIIELQIGDRETAVTTWKTGIESSGPDARLEHLLRLEAEGKTTQEILNTPPPRP
ncbi:MAG: hypothetical protein AAGA81_09625 [Acidobacteriota bacterium]